MHLAETAQLGLADGLVNFVTNERNRYMKLNDYDVLSPAHMTRWVGDLLEGNLSSHYREDKLSYRALNMTGSSGLISVMIQPKGEKMQTLVILKVPPGPFLSCQVILNHCCDPPR